MKPRFQLEPDEEDALTAQATDLAVREGHLLPSLIVGNLEVTYECAEHISHILQGRGVIDRSGKLTKQSMHLTCLTPAIACNFIAGWLLQYSEIRE